MSEKERPVNDIVKRRHQEMLDRLRKTFELEAMVNDGMPAEWAIAHADKMMETVHQTLKEATD